MKAATINSMARGYVSRISIHAAREGGDGIVLDETEFTVRFQSTPPVKAATDELYINAGLMFISIHAAREGGD